MTIEYQLYFMDRSHAGAVNTGGRPSCTSYSHIHLCCPSSTNKGCYRYSTSTPPTRLSSQHCRVLTSFDRQYPALLHGSFSRHIKSFKTRLGQSTPSILCRANVQGLYNSRTIFTPYVVCFLFIYLFVLLVFVWFHQSSLIIQPQHSLINSFVTASL